jgi:hypoxanthine phosphoribosyltransferase
VFPSFTCLLDLHFGQSIVFIQIYKIYFYLAIPKFDWLYHSSEGLYDLWSICDNENQKKLVENLVNNFTYTTSKELNESGEEIAELIEEKWLLKPSNSFLVAKCDDRKPDGSQAFLQSLKNKFSHEWEGKNFYNNLLEAAHKIEDDSNIILIDDFIGTGETIKSKYKYFVKKLTERGIKNYKIRIVSFAAMEFSKSRLNSLTEVEYYSAIWLKKGISELITDAKEIRAANLEMKNLENKLSNTYKNLNLTKHSFGYKSSESLFTLESFNIPNNVFPIFWWPQLKNNTYYKTLFKRL